ncbi:hypothetical protein [Marinifilum fragile]|uniref:Kelch repeat-containing protein n=1 Tax=Marinifilum fragile TaxID=570161 RepID=UPI002AA7127A|nr:hypothetical protein [Marinifilum fragile]
MKRILTLFIAATTLFSCTKSSHEEDIDDGKLYDVNFSVSTFNQEITDLKSTPSLAAVINNLVYIVYNSNGDYMYHKVYADTEENFGQVTDKLAAGDYSLVFLGLLDFDENNLGKGKLGMEAAEYTYPSDIYDTFYKRLNFTVGESDDAQAVTLDRVAGKLEVSFTEDIPEEVKKIKLIVTGFKNRLQLSDGYSWNDVNVTKQYTLADDSRPAGQFNAGLFSLCGNEITCDLTIQGLDADNNVLVAKNIKGFEIFKNKITRLSGKMFGGNSEQNIFDIQINSVWDEVIEQNFNGEISYSGNWIKKSSFEGSSRSGAVSFVIGDYAYVGTGYDGKDCLKTFYKYSLTQGWTKIQSEFPGVSRREAVAFTANGKAYVGLGVDNNDERLGDFYEFDPTTDTWNTTPIDMSNGPTARQGAVAFSINGIGYVGTGYGFQDGDDRNNLKDFYKYENGTWNKIAFPGEKTRNSTVSVINNKAYIISGESNLTTKYVWEYNPAKVSSMSNGWTRKKDLNNDNGCENAQRTQAVSFVIDAKAYIATGRKSGLSREVWEYDPTLDSWKQKTSLENEIASREDAVAFSLNNRGFISTGTDTNSFFDDTWEFNPNMNQNDSDN